ncbi:exodeoxyribonuclease V subunit gamma [Pandoraea sp.]|uniref:exodeoxyribonuclease V subunit gamma n=1 Tax=Pandoraea sp. TaxID=1883445 RepID=UPI001226D9B6|nr:exodeoxyribonuclease V subunit gamma [Pandoraea sp.]TAL55769.1 MAG: exodeoxyribonuclease V subunit gamma [Pandoraea sp.]TAM19373.1 MAG: exodeoxyribonuclease V subunit gamma [Pandoraea sp.]
MLSLFFSNRYENLAAALLRDVAAQPADPLAREVILVPSAAVRRRLELDYAQCFGVCANVQFAYLAQWLWEQLGRALPVPRTSPFAPDRLVWPIYRCLDDAGWTSDFPRLTAYLRQADPVMRYELAERLASLFDQYLTYRLPWLTHWQHGASIAPTAPAALVHWGPPQFEDERWQAELWRQLLTRLEIAGEHPAQRFIEILRALPAGQVPAGWPARVAVFALPAMPPLSMQLLKELSRLIDVRIYALNPCQEYWFEIVPAARLSYLQARGASGYHETGHPLLAEWGRQTQSHIDLLYAEMAEGALCDDAVFTPNPASTLLSTLQNGILWLAPRPETDAPGAGDGSLAVHACHSLARQLEVTHDQLLDWFEADPSLQPDDVLIAVPDLSQAASLIDAVFGTASPRIPYLVTGLPASHTNMVARAVRQLLALPRRRVGAADIIELIRTEAVAHQFQFDEAALEQIQQWLRAAGARRGWASDPLMRLARASASAGAAEAEQRHTLGDALMRLLLGYAQPDDAMPSADWLPIGGIEGGRAQALGSLAGVIDALEASALALGQPRNALAWRDTLLTLLETFFSPDAAFADDIAEVRQAIDQLCAAMHDGAPDTELPVGVIDAALARWLDDPARGGVPSGRVTFAALPSLRALPYRVICLLGMDDGVLPGLRRGDEFDLMHALPQRGDRQRRDDERNLFLDLLLAARERVLIAYNGRSIRDNAILPPSAVVAELLDHLADILAGPGAGEQALARHRASLVTEHPLQPFAPAYFDGASPRLFSYDAMQAETARVILGAGAAPRDETAFCQTPLPRPPARADALELDDLLRFWRHPTRVWVRERLGVALREAEAELDDDEPFEVDAEARRTFAERVLPRLLAGEAPQRVARIAAASHELPAGATGALWRVREMGGLQLLAGAVRDALGAGSSAHAFSLSLALRAAPEWPHEWQWPQGLACRLQGRLAPLTPNGLVLYRYGRARASDYLDAWLRHLVLGALVARGELPGVTPRTRWFGDDESFALRPVEDPIGQLAQLVALQHVGMTRPLPFFPRSAWELVSTGQLANAEKAWLGSQFSFGEGDEAYYRLAWRGIDAPLAEPFETIARGVCEPLAAHLVAGGAPA